MNAPDIDIEQQQWDLVIKPKTGLFEINFKDVWSYRDLLVLLVRRDFVAMYKQTILGPIWFVLQPILTTLTYMLIFGNIAGIKTGEVPQIVFYLAGISLWNYYSECLTRTSTVFKDNSNIFGKVYFPRLIMPLSIVVSNLVKLGIQLGLFLLFWGFFLFKGQLHPNWEFVLLAPYLVILLGLLGLGCGMIISAMTTKYRDLALLLTFAIQLLMYATPIIYPISKALSKVPVKYQWAVWANPMGAIVETFRFGFLGEGTFSWGGLIYSTAFTIAVLIFGTLIFNKVEKNFMDTV